MSKVISASTGPIFTIFSLNGRYLRDFSWSGPVFSDSSRDVAMATNFVSYRTCSLRAEVSEDPLDQFSQSLHRMVSIELRMISPIFFFRYLKGRCHGNQLKSKNWLFLRTNILCRAAIPKGIAISLSRFQNITENVYLYILHNFGDIRSRNHNHMLTIAPFVAIRQKSAYHTNYLRMFWTYLDLLYRFGRRISGDDFTTIRLAVAQGTLLWQPVKYGRRSQTSRGTTFTLCFGSRKRIGRS